jgi:hypothetical protein
LVALSLYVVKYFYQGRAEHISSIIDIEKGYFVTIFPVKGGQIINVTIKYSGLGRILTIRLRKTASVAALR